LVPADGVEPPTNGLQEVYKNGSGNVRASSPSAVVQASDDNCGAGLSQIKFRTVNLTSMALDAICPDSAERRQS